MRQPVRKILRALDRYETAGTTAPTLLRETGLSRPTLLRYLGLLVKEDVITRPFRGQYVYVRDEMDILRDPEGYEGIHGWTLTVRANEGNILLPTVANRLRSRPDARPFESGRWVSIYESWKNHLIEFRVYRTGTLNVYIPATRNPISWLESEELAGWLEAKLEPLSSDRLWVTQYGVQIDHRDWRMKDVGAIEFRGWRNAHRQMYERRVRGATGIRDEVHGHHRTGELSLATAVRILKEGSADAIRFRMEQTRLRELEKEIELERLKGENPKAAIAIRRELKPSPLRPPPSDMYG